MPGFAPAQITAEDLALARAYLDACGIAAESATSLLDGLPARLGRRYPDNWLRHHLRTALLAELRHLGRRYGQPAEPLEPDCVLDIDAAGLRALRVLPPALRDAWFASSGFALAPDAAARALGCLPRTALRRQQQARQLITELLAQRDLPAAAGLDALPSRLVAAPPPARPLPAAPTTLPARSRALYLDWRISLRRTGWSTLLAVCLLGSGTLAWRQWQAPPDVNGALDLRLLAGELAPAAYLDKDSAP
ncbi:hypothetical protein LHK_00155 [Laribacter hongkongensis HLHK9]|uniref:Uncharacterized protein n=1 Tax=Laribacter hongkongensis (strain HLHK9) TaxID=557598 RepID=C1DA38_LARHH|nr:hypothetical protein [Laribacter hongkongensis]ACO73151.1 hypothetical protein LHK_00155 [Laribacter hongkongensis HLHK9]